MADTAVHQLQVARVQAQRLNSDGDGVAQIGGMTVFVPNLLPGEWATVRVTAVEKRFARAVVLSLGGDAEATDVSDPQAVAAEPPLSEHRSTPLCPVFELCGGCQLQHVSYAKQLAHKRQVVVDALTRIGHLPDVDVLPTLGMAQPWRYRNQVQIPLTYDRSTARYTSGFFAADSHQLVATDACHLISEAMETTLRAVVSRLSRAARAVGGDLNVHHLILRESHTTHAQMVVFAHTSDAAAGPLQTVWDEVYADTARLANVTTVAVTVQPRRHGPVWGPKVRVVSGMGLLTETLGGLEFLISPRSFFQTNTTQTARLYEQALAAADVQPTDSVLDAYCGTGTMSLLFAQRAQRVVGIDSISAAIDDARRNTQHNHIGNVDFRVGLVEQELPRLVREGHSWDLAVLDPPRKGCDPAVLHALTAPEARPRRIVYVSCSPATLARDLRLLVDAGYQLGPVQPVDMFPQTSHVECCVSLVRKD